MYKLIYPLVILGVFLCPKCLAESYQFINKKEYTNETKQVILFTLMSKENITLSQEEIEITLGGSFWGTTIHRTPFVMPAFTFLNNYFYTDKDCYSGHSIRFAYYLCKRDVNCEVSSSFFNQGEIFFIKIEWEHVHYPYQLHEFLSADCTIEIKIKKFKQLTYHKIPAQLPPPLPSTDFRDIREDEFKSRFADERFYKSPPYSIHLYIDAKDEIEYFQSEWIKVRPGKRIRLSFFYRTDDFLYPDFFVTILGFDTNRMRDILLEERVRYRRDWGWKDWEYVFTIPEDICELNIKLKMNEPGSAWISDLKLEYTDKWGP